ncbi:hypothetical protein BC830DRAFT_1233680 [Chytriomyces sp. MP71]|nr:hypothetical protein BC830DRAFT_1233680 [Chytriomyces sp. MP71]
MATVPSAATTTSLVPSDSPACQVNIARFAGFGFPSQFDDKGSAIPGLTYDACVQLMLSQRATIKDFLFDETNSPSNCQDKGFLNAPGAVMQLFRLAIGPFSGRACTQDGFNLGATIASSSDVCGKACEINPACAGGQWVILGKKVTKLGVSVSYFTGQECGGGAEVKPFEAAPEVTSLESMRVAQDKPSKKTGAEAVDMMATDVGNGTSLPLKEVTATVTVGASVIICAKAAMEPNVNKNGSLIYLSSLVVLFASAVHSAQVHNRRQNTNVPNPDNSPNLLNLDAPPVSVVRRDVFNMEGRR